MYACVAALAIALPSDLIDNRFFGRPVAPRTIDYIILATTAAFIGLILAIRPTAATGVTEIAEAQDRRTYFSGALTFLAVGCPVCNQAVIALVGASGALAWWAPIQPVVGLAAIAVLIYTLSERLRTYKLAACPL